MMSLYETRQAVKEFTFFARFGMRQAIDVDATAMLWWIANWRREHAQDRESPHVDVGGES